MKVYKFEDKKTISNLMNNMYCFGVVEIINDIVSIFNDKIGKRELVRVYLFELIFFLFVFFFYLFLVVT
jgi:hypothetical protein